MGQADDWFNVALSVLAPRGRGSVKFPASTTFRAVATVVWRVPGLVAALAVGIVWIAPAYAQSVPGSVAPGQIEKRFQARPSPKKEVAPLIPGVSHEVPPEQARNIRFTLSAVVIDGVTAYPENAFASLYQNLLAREVSLADIYAIAKKSRKNMPPTATSSPRPSFRPRRSNSASSAST